MRVHLDTDIGGDSDDACALAHPPERERRLQERAELLQAESHTRGPMRKDHGQLGAHSPYRFHDEQRREHPGHARVQAMLRFEMPDRPRRRREDERRSPIRMRRRKPGRDDAAERHAANHRALDPRLVERADNLRHEIIKTTRRIEGHT